MEEEDEIHQSGQLCKFPRVANEELEEHGGGGGGGRREGLGGFNSNWHHSSRIIRVSRASGGKDRHSKVMTSKGLRDRRVRLSVTTAIQFYDLQDRLGYDQPSKAVEWLIKSASDAISELPSLNNTFPDTPKQPSDEKRVFDSADAEVPESNNANNANYQLNQNLSLSKSGCSSNSETSKGSGLSLARSDIRVNRVKARERARTRTAKEKEKEVNEQQQQQQPPSQSHNNNNNNVPHQTASFTELLTGGMNNTNSPSGSVSVHHQHHHHNQGNNNENEARQQWSSAPMDYFSPMLLGASSRTQQQTSAHGFSLLSLPEHQAMSLSPFSNNNGGENHYSFIPHHDNNQHHHHLMPQAVVTSSSSMNEYNLNFTISSSSTTTGLVGYNRGTLQSNSPSFLPHQLQRFSSIDGSSSSSSSTLPFFMGHGVAAQPPQHAPSMENNHQHHHQFSSPFDANRLHLCYGDACRHSDQKGKPKN